MTLAGALRAWLLADATIAAALGGRVHYQHIPESSIETRIWFSRSGRQDFESLEQDADDPATHAFDMELIGEPFNGPLIETVRRRLIDLDTTYEGIDFQGVWVEDADDSYLFKSIGEDDPIYVYALQITVIA